MIKSVIDLHEVGCLHQIPWFPWPVKSTTMIKTHNPPIIHEIRFKIIQEICKNVEIFFPDFFDLWLLYRNYMYMYVLHEQDPVWRSCASWTGPSVRVLCFMNRTRREGPVLHEQDPVWRSCASWTETSMKVLCFMNRTQREGPVLHEQDPAWRSCASWTGPSVKVLILLTCDYYILITC